jgi:alcohol dehydrogenase class IV
VLGDLDPARVLLVTDERVWASCPTLREAVATAHPDQLVTRASGETDLAALDRILEAVGRHPDPILVAAGGGRVMDVARLAGLLSADPQAASLLRPRLGTTQGLMMWPAARDAACPVLCVPTTIGTAAEVSPVAMVRTASSTAPCHASPVTNSS